MIGIVSGIKRCAVHDGEGLRTTVFLKGCPLKCLWCHNPESISFQCELGCYAEKCLGCGTCVSVCRQGALSLAEGSPIRNKALCVGCMDCAQACPADALVAYGKAWDHEALAEKLLQDKCFFDSSHGGVTISGGECLAQPEFTVALAARLQQLGIRVNIDTCGYTSRIVIEQVAPYTDTFLYDIKAIDPAVHLRCTGRDNARILENLHWLCDNGHRVEIRYPYVPGYNDTECEAIGHFLSQLPGITRVKVLGYHSLADGKYRALGMENTLPPKSAYRMRYGEKGVDWTDADPGTTSFAGMEAEIKVINQSIFGGSNAQSWNIVQATIGLANENERSQYDPNSTDWGDLKLKMMGECYNANWDAYKAQGGRPKNVVMPLVYTTEEDDEVSVWRNNTNYWYRTCRASFIKGVGELNDPSNDAQWQKYIDGFKTQGYYDWLTVAQDVYDFTYGNKSGK